LIGDWATPTGHCGIFLVSPSEPLVRHSFGISWRTSISHPVSKSFWVTALPAVPEKLAWNRLDEPKLAAFLKAVEIASTPI
jgi:hypothetical protein